MSEQFGVNWGVFAIKYATMKYFHRYLMYYPSIRPGEYRERHTIARVWGGTPKPR